MHKLILLLLGILYYFLIQVNITVTKQYNKSIFISIQSHIPQQIKLHIQAKRNTLRTIYCNQQIFSFPHTGRLWFARNNKEIAINLQRETNHCQIILHKDAQHFKTILKRKYTYIDYIAFFIFFGLPFISVLFKGLLWILEKIRMKTALSPNPHHVEKTSIYLLMILFLGMGIRVLYFQKFGVTNFQHDWQGHIEFLKYIATHWSLPLGEEGLQFPQQPLYYVITAGLYTLGIKLGLEDMQALHMLGYFALFCSFVFLYYGYKFFILITENKWIQMLAMLFIAFTPALVYMSALINNDVLVMALASYALYYSVKGYFYHFKHYFYRALLGVSLLFISKISAASMEILLFALLILSYLSQENRATIKRNLFLFSIVGMFLLGITLLKVYLPIEQAFHMVNSHGFFPNQHIPSLDIRFFFYLDIEHLFGYEATETYLKDTATYTFLNHQYRTMLIGEFNYRDYFEHMHGLKQMIRAIFFFGFIYIIGFLTYIVSIKKTSTLEKLFLIIVLINLSLILRFIFEYPSISNTDFRYFAPNFIVLGYIFAKGLSYLRIYRIAQYLLTILATLLVMTEIYFFILLLR